MKKLIIILALILFALPVFAEYKPIPVERRAEYKAEIEQIINNKYLPIKKEIDNTYSEATIKYYAVMKNKSLYESFTDSFYDNAVFNPIFYLFSDMLKITQKYVNIKNDIPPTDYTGALYDFLDPYFKDNNISTVKIDELSEYARTRQIKIEQYYINAHKFVYPNDDY